MNRRRQREVDAIQFAQSAEIARLHAAIQTPLMSRATGTHHIVTANPKGGTGKTTTSALIALLFAELRAEIAALVCANPHMGTVRRRTIPANVPAPTPFIELCFKAVDGEINAEWATLAKFADVPPKSRLRVFSNFGADPVHVEALQAEEYTAGIEILLRAAQIVISDMGTSFSSDAALAAWDCADSLIFATDLTQDSLELTIEMVSAMAGKPKSYRAEPDDYSAISDGRYASLVRGSIVALSPGRGDDGEEGRLAELIDWLRAVCGGGVFMIPKDQHLVGGDLIIPSALQPATLISYLGIAAAVAARFPMSSEG